MTICFIIGDILANKHCTRLPFRKKATNSSQSNIVSLTSQIIWSLEFLDCMHHVSWISSQLVFELLLAWYDKSDNTTLKLMDIETLITHRAYNNCKMFLVKT